MGAQMSINIKKATLQDVPFLAEMVLQSSRGGKNIGLFDLVFPTHNTNDNLLLLEKLLTTTTIHKVHFSNFLVAEVDGKNVGTLCTYEPRIATKEALLKAFDEISINATDSEAMRVVELCGFEINNKILFFDYMKEIDGFIDVGILKALMQKSLLTARLKGYRIVQTIVEAGSLETLMYYKKLGFKESEHSECDEYKELFGRTGLLLLSMEF